MGSLWTLCQTETTIYFPGMEGLLQGNPCVGQPLLRQSPSDQLADGVDKSGFGVSAALCFRQTFGPRIYVVLVNCAGACYITLHTLQSRVPVLRVAEVSLEPFYRC